MRWMTLVPFLCGVAVVTQSGLNRRFVGQLGLLGAALANMAVALSVVAAAVLLWRWLPGGPPAQARFGPFTAWNLVPGVCGVVLVVGMPLAIRHLGAATSVVALLAAQLLTSLVWDAAFEGRPVTLIRAVGITLAFAGAALAVWEG
jgi:bacterial/archaeal transporter family-2 protein